MIFHQTFTRIRASETTDRGGNTVLDWSTPDRLVLKKANVAPLLQQEPGATDIREVTTTGWRITTRMGTGDVDLTAADRVEIRSGTELVTCEVIGEVARWYHPLTGRISNIECTVKRAKG